MINSATTFPVELVYATRGDAMSNFGSISSSLPRPDMIVTNTNWDVYVPASPSYARPKTNMDILAVEVMTSVKTASAQLLRGAVANVISGEPLHIELPTQGLLYRFAKLYANQSAEDARFSLRYVNQSAGFVGLWLSLLATLAAWAGVVLLGAGVRGPEREIQPGFMGLNLHHGLQSQSLYLPWILIVAGVSVIALCIGVLGVSVTPPSILSLLIAVMLLTGKAWDYLSLRRAAHGSS